MSNVVLNMILDLLKVYLENRFILIGLFLVVGIFIENKFYKRLKKFKGARLLASFLLFRWDVCRFIRRGMEAI